MIEDIFISRKKTLLFALDKNNMNHGSWLGLSYPKLQKEFGIINKNEDTHFITIDISRFFNNSKDKSISLFFDNKKKLPSWKYVMHQTDILKNEDLLGLKFDTLFDDINPIKWMNKNGYGTPKSKIGGKPSFIQEKIETDKEFILQINWEDLIFTANKILGKKFNIVSEAFMGGNLYLYSQIDRKNKIIDLDEIDIYHQYL